MLFVVKYSYVLNSSVRDFAPRNVTVTRRVKSRSKIRLVRDYNLDKMLSRGAITRYSVSRAK